jgi:hypothetical protein
MLLNLLAFSLDYGDENGEDNTPNTSRIFSPHDPEQLSSFSLQLGLKPLLAATAHLRASSSNNTTTILAQMYGHKTPHVSKPYYSSGETPPTHPLPPHWLSFLSDGGDKDEDDNPRLEPARMLAQARDMPPRADSFLSYVEFVGAPGHRLTLPQPARGARPACRVAAGPVWAVLLVATGKGHEGVAGCL